ncbi:MAG TPA: LysR family transcriptional regulator, partial [Beijerinckiaceae bacterium]|nr:LysR family transcriptional regulator [Beijerinckiaceae bacterium]
MTQPAADLRRLDLNLLPVFLALMRERNVTRAGESLSLSQPATSAALARLRATFNDPLFIANGRRLEPTPRAESLCSELDPALQMVSAAIFGSIPFEPMTDNHVFHIGCTEDVMLILRPMFRAMRRAAPKCGVVIHAANYRTIPLLLDSGEIGTAFGYMGDDLPANVYRRVLRRGGFKVLRDASSAGPVDLDMYCARPHVLVTPRGDLKGFVDPILEKLGRRREVLVGVPDYGLLPHILRESQMLSTVNSLLA